MLDPKKVYVGISILSRGSIGVFDLDDEQSKRKVNGSNRSSKIPGENSEGNYLSKLQYATRGFRCEKVSSYLPSKGYFFCPKWLGFNFLF